jgi:hypothetical protein
MPALVRELDRLIQGGESDQPDSQAMERLGPLLGFQRDPASLYHDPARLSPDRFHAGSRLPFIPPPHDDHEDAPNAKIARNMRSTRRA